MRRKDNSRKAKREEQADKKRIAEEQKRAELKRLKNLRRKIIEKELLDAFSKSGTGDAEAITSKFGVEDLEEDFDLDKWDAKMKQVFDDDYYNQKDEEIEKEREHEEAEPEEEELVEGEGGELMEEEEGGELVEEGGEPIPLLQSGTKATGRRAIGTRGGG